MNSKNITLSLLCLFCYTSVVAQAATDGQNRTNNAQAITGIPAVTRPQFDVKQSQVTKDQDQNIRIRFDETHSTSFKPPQVVSKTDNRVEVITEGVLTTPAGNTPFTSQAITQWEKAGPNKLRKAELTINSSLSGETFTNTLEFAPATGKTPALYRFTAATGLECTFTLSSNEVWGIVASSESRWIITVVDATSYLASNGTSTKKITITGGGAAANIVIASHTGVTYNISANSLIAP